MDAFPDSFKTHSVDIVSEYKNNRRAEISKAIAQCVAEKRNCATIYIDYAWALTDLCILRELATHIDIDSIEILLPNTKIFKLHNVTGEMLRTFAQKCEAHIFIQVKLLN